MNMNTFLNIIKFTLLVIVFFIVGILVGVLLMAYHMFYSAVIVGVFFLCLLQIKEIMECKKDG
jgi:hypothetical protein